MDRYWKNVVCPIIKSIQAKNIIEIGANDEINTKNILDYCMEYNAYLTSIGSSSNFDVEKFKLKYCDHFTFIDSLSSEAFPSLNAFDVVLIYGDHNWDNICDELKAIEKNFNNQMSFPLIFLQGIGSLYVGEGRCCNPKTMPEGYVQQYKKLGITFPDETFVNKEVFNSDFFNECSDNSLKNCVLTSIEEFILESSLQITFIKIPLFDGLGILFIDDLKFEKKINEIINSSDMFQLIENELIETQFANAFHIEENNRLLKEKEVQYEELLNITNKNISNELLISDMENQIRILKNENHLLKNELKESKINTHTLTAQKNLIYSENEYNTIQLQKTKSLNQKYENEITNMETKLQISNSQKNIILSELNKNKNRIQELSMENRDFQKDYEKYKSSSCWKITKLLRLVSSKLKFKRKNE